MTQRLALGTAQFGLDYGVTNAHGRLDDTTVASLLADCAAHAIDTLDTAGGYGDSESRLGAALRALPPQPWRIVTKTPAAQGDRIDAGVLAAFDRAWQASKQRLAPLQPHALLAHHADDLLRHGAEALHAWLRERRDRGEVAKIGVSVYEPDQLARLVDRHGRDGRAFDVVQLPCNVADQRFARLGWLAALREQGVEVHVRSLFLQGLLLAPGHPQAARAGEGAATWLARFHAEARARGVSPLQACLGFFRSVPHFDVAVVGATSQAELAAIGAAFQHAVPAGWDDPATGATWTDPRTWRVVP